LILQFPDINTTIHPTSQTVAIDGKQHTVRPKTFALLQALIEANGELVSKAELLNTVWDDVVVDEQVVFQSVKELRKLFSGYNVIKTVPRKGYAWIPSAASQVVADDLSVQTKKSTRWLAITCCVTVLLLFVGLHEFSSTPQVVSGSVVVLPVQSDISGNDHDWVRYGVMDQVISRLSSTEHAGVLQTDYVMEVMARAETTLEDVALQRISPIFDVSGAELVVVMRFTGTPNDYQLLYTLYQRDGVERGVALASTVQNAADKVTQIIGERLNPDFSLSDSGYVSSFSKQLIAEALDAKRKGDAQGALKLLNAAMVSSPQDLTAARLHVQLLVETGASPERVYTVALPALSEAKIQSRSVEQVRLGFWLAMSEFTAGKYEEALARFEDTQSLAASINDWLYLAYMEEILGQYSQSQQQFEQAKQHFNLAMDYHKVLHCPLGQSNTLMHQSRLAYAQQNSALALDKAEDAIAIIKGRNLREKLPGAMQWLSSLKTSQHPEK
jgi:transcriptional activator of cad operon|tara:strand:+ start:1585 stop:3081 length:1497 start_codon:yes stop_codon:yes gene_type:complete